MSSSPSQASSLKEKPPVEPAEPSQNALKGPKGGPPGGGPPDDIEYPPTSVALLVMSSAFLAMFLVSLDRTVLATAIPYITNDFHSLSDIGWYGSSYLLANCAIQPLYGKIYKFYSAKWVLTCAIVIFEIGSALCGAAPNSNAFIVGRALAGAGSAGVMSGNMQVMLLVVPITKRAMYTGIFSAIFGISSAVGPLLGGVFTQRVSWRWCFYINLPFAVPCILFILLLLKTNAPREASTSVKEQIRQLDPIGTFVFIPSMTSLLLALQWGGVTYAWSSGRIVALLVVFAVTIVAWFGIEYWQKDRATISLRIIRQRSILSGVFYAFFLSGSMMLVQYYLAIWFQAIKGVTPIKSGISSLPFVLALVAASTIAGFVTQKLGYYVPSMIFAPCFASIGAGLFTTLRTNTGHSHWIAYEFLYGFGIGAGMMQATLAAQATLPRQDIPIGMAAMFFALQFGGTVFLSVGENLFSQKLVSQLSSLKGLGLDPSQIVKTGATDLRKIVPQDKLHEVLVAYNAAIVHVWYLGLAMICLAIIPACCMEWKNIKGMKPGGPGGGPGGKPPQGAGSGGPSASEKKGSTQEQASAIKDMQAQGEGQAEGKKAEASDLV